MAISHDTGTHLVFGGGRLVCRSEWAYVGGVLLRGRSVVKETLTVAVEHSLHTHTHRVLCVTC